MNPTKIIYWSSTLIMCAIFSFSAGMYLTNYEVAEGFYESLGYPAYLIYPSAIAKALGVIAVLSKKSKLLKEWAYAGFFFDSLLATVAHHFNGDGLGLSVVALIMTIISRIYDDKLFR